MVLVVMEQYNDCCQNALCFDGNMAEVMTLLKSMSGKHIQHTFIALHQLLL